MQKFSILAVLLMLAVGVAACGTGLPEASPTVFAQPTSTHQSGFQATAAHAEALSPTAAASSQPPSDASIPSLAGLPIEDFLEQSFELLLSRDPELVVELGLSGMMEEESELTDISDAYIQETQSLQIAILETLRQYDRGTLTPEQQISYDVYEWYLEDLVRGHPLSDHKHPNAGDAVLHRYSPPCRQRGCRILRRPSVHGRREVRTAHRGSANS